MTRTETPRAEVVVVWQGTRREVNTNRTAAAIDTTLESMAGTETGTGVETEIGIASRESSLFTTETLIGTI